MDYNHPSIFIWGVRLNESNDCPELYTRTNELAKRLDPDRATTGVRYFYLRAVSLRKMFTLSMISAIRQVKYLKRGADERPHFVAVFLCTPFFFIFFDSLVFRNRVFFWMFSSDCLIPYF